MSTQKQLLENMRLQSILNSKGANLIVDGIVGPKTQAAMQKYLGVNTPAYGGATSSGQSMSSNKPMTTTVNSGAGKAYYAPTSGASAQTAAYTRPQPLNQQERDILGAFKSVGTSFQKKMFLKEIEENGERAVYNKYVGSAARERERMEQERLSREQENRMKNSVTSGGVKTETKKPYDSGTTFTSTFDGMAEQVQAVMDGLKKGLISMEEKPRVTGNGRTTFTPMYGETGSEVRELLALYGITPGQLMQNNPKSAGDRGYALNGHKIPDSITNIQSMRNLLDDRTALEKQGSVSHALSGGNMGQGQVKSVSTQHQSTFTQAQRQEIRRLQQERDKQLKIIEQLPAWERTTALGAGPGPRCAAAMQAINEIDREIAEVGSTMMIPAPTQMPTPSPANSPYPSSRATPGMGRDTDGHIAEYGKWEMKRLEDYQALATEYGALSYDSKEDLLQSDLVNLVARTIYGEQSKVANRGQEAVAWEIANRVLSQKEGEFTIKGLVSNLYTIVSKDGAYSCLNINSGTKNSYNQKTASDEGWINAVRLAGELVDFFEQNYTADKVLTPDEKDSIKQNLAEYIGESPVSNYCWHRGEGQFNDYHTIEDGKHLYKGKEIYPDYKNRNGNVFFNYVYMKN